ncbi:nucleotidyltransferase domain-containing protein [Sulfurimonas sp.]|uniref:[protein-PII] uridylyltransferase family protein n=1 Tax=Sulfurimonas sp. TaxID=2022749 RepID=UPI00260C4449|nr:nucleotidyltransferase domain-containing protein [Sulfurimonas sp.]
MNLLLEIENIIEKNGSDFELSKLFRQYIKEYKESLPELFTKNQGKDFLVRHTKKLDSIIDLMYKTVLRRVFGNYLPMRSSIPIAIVALGSYGREQLSVQSDIDLLIVYKDVEGYNTKLIIEKLFYLALDAGMKLGHRVHEVADLYQASTEDVTIKTSLMESRLITGSPFTWHATQRELNKIRLDKQKEFIIAKIEEAQIRRKKYPSTMQPNIKESVGGLRDTHLIFWIAKTIYGIDTIKELSGTVFSEDEYKEYRIALELLYRVRSALHLITKKQEDRLLLEYIPEVSKLLGFKEQKKLASKVLEAEWRINNFVQIFVKKMVRQFIYDTNNIMTFKRGRIQKGFYLNDSRLYASFHLPKQDIKVLLQLLIDLEDKHYRFDAGFLYQFTTAKIIHPLSGKIYILLKELMKKEHIACFLELFYDAGILEELFPNFKKVMHLPQFDGYHQYPVDVHSIKCVEALENISDPFLKTLYQALNGDEKLLLKIVVFFHDSGKGRVQDHSEVGAKLVAQFTKKINISEENIKRAVTLTRHHVLMSSVAFKENIHNEKTLYKFMSKIEDTKNLKLLYLLTYADISGVGGDIYNSFNAKLLFDLYQNALEVAENKGRITDAKKRLLIETRVKNLAEFKELPSLLQKKILTIESSLFFFKHSPQDIIHIAKIARETKEYSFSVKHENSLSIEIFRHIPLNISYLLATLAHLQVGSMEIFTLFDGLKYFKIEFIQNVDENILVEVQDIIDNAFDMSKKVPLKKITILKNEINIDCEHSLTHAELTIHTANQTGLLAYVMYKFEELGINIITAKIHSSKHKVRDSFLMEKQNKICNNVENIYEVLSARPQ